MITLRDYQNRIADWASDLLQDHKIAYLAMECRTGKTLTAFATAMRYGATSVLMVSKKKALASISADYELMQPSFKLRAINYESVHTCADGDYDLIILDEAHSIGSFPKPSLRAKTLKPICAGLPIIYLSGTPTPESYSQIYHQFWVSSFSPFALYTNFYRWAKSYVDIGQRKINGHTIADYSHAYKDKIDAVTKHLFIDYSQEEAGFEAKIVETILCAPMHPWTAKALRTIRRDKILEWTEAGSDPRTITVLADTPAKLMTKMHQLSSGTVIDNNGEHVITDTCKAEFVKKHFQGCKIAIFYVYQSELDMLKMVFPKWTNVPEEFQKSEDNELVFMAQVRSAREGVRLDKADALIFYNLEYSYLSYEQGRNRLSSKERETPAQIYFICSDCGIESDILDAVHSKQDFTMSYFKNKHKHNFIN